MRETLRGALLSVLFFALLIGGAPTMAVAGDKGGTMSGCHDKPGVNCPPPTLSGFCDDLQTSFDDGTQDMTWGSGAVAAGGLAASGMGVGAMIVGGITGIGWGLARIGRGVCKATGNWG